MGDLNQLAFVRRHARHFQGPYLEVGSKDYGSTQDLRSIFVDRGRYVGVDLQDGDGVDLVLDLAGDFSEIDAALHHARFGTIFCMSVLEHCRQPFRMAENLTRLLRPGGRLCVSAPFAWKYYGYPCDYWRFTHEGIRTLFSELDFDGRDATAATSETGEFTSLDRELGRIAFSSKAHWRKGRLVRGLSAKLLATLARLGLLRWLARYRYVLAPTNVMMVGAKPSS